MADAVQGVIRSPRIQSQQTSLQANEKQELLSAQGLPPYTEMTRKGNGWHVMSVLAVAGSSCVRARWRRSKCGTATPPAGRA
jgi:hypothetical protein